MLAELAKIFTNQLKIEPVASDQDQSATASKDTQQMVINASNADQDKL
jgi:hypothetical protein